MNIEDKLRLGLLHASAVKVTLEASEHCHALLEAVACFSLGLRGLGPMELETLRLIREHLIRQIDAIHAFSMELGDTFACGLSSPEKQKRLLAERPRSYKSGAELYETYLAEHRVQHAGEGHVS